MSEILTLSRPEIEALLQIEDGFEHVLTFVLVRCEWQQSIGLRVRLYFV